MKVSVDLFVSFGSQCFGNTWWTYCQLLILHQKSLPVLLVKLTNQSVALSVTSFQLLCVITLCWSVFFLRFVYVRSLRNFASLAQLPRQPASNLRVRERWSGTNDAISCLFRWRWKLTERGAWASVSLTDRLSPVLRRSFSLNLAACNDVRRYASPRVAYGRAGAWTGYQPVNVCASSITYTTGDRFLLCTSYCHATAAFNRFVAFVTRDAPTRRHHSSCCVTTLRLLRRSERPFGAEAHAGRMCGRVRRDKLYMQRAKWQCDASLRAVRSSAAVVAGCWCRCDHTRAFNTIYFTWLQVKY